MRINTFSRKYFPYNFFPFIIPKENEEKQQKTETDIIHKTQESKKKRYLYNRLMSCERRSRWRINFHTGQVPKQITTTTTTTIAVLSGARAFSLQIRNDSQNLNKSFGKP